MPRLAVVGAGWAGLAAAVRAVQAGWQVAVLEMAPLAGGRARSLPGEAVLRDNGQHILIGAYRRTLGLMAELGVPLDQALLRLPLSLQDVQGRGLALPAAPLWWALPRAVLGAQGWSLSDKISLLHHAARWAAARFRCDPHWTVDELCRALPTTLRQSLIDPLCVAAMNTPSHEASASVFLRVLHDALLSGPGSADMLLPRWSLAELLPLPAERWLRQHGAQFQLGRRVTQLQAVPSGWVIDDKRFDAVVLSCSATEAARLAAPHAPAWARRAEALSFEPIVTVQLRCPGARLPRPISALRDGPEAPAQFLFDHGAISGEAAAGWFSAVISGATPWVKAGRQATGDAVLAQLLAQLPAGSWPQPLAVAAVQAERRATFRCVPGLQRPAASIAARLVAAADYVEGPYPATLEGAVMSAEAAVAALQPCLAPPPSTVVPHSS